MMVAFTSCFFSPRFAKKPQPRWLLLCLGLWLGLGWQAPLWAQSATPQAEAAAWSVSLAPEVPRFGAQSASPEALPDSALVPPNWYWTMSFLIPGMAQMLMDEPEHGLLFFLGFVSSIALVPVTVGVFTTQNQPEAANLSGANVLSWIFAATTAGFYVVNLIDAYFLNQDKLTAAQAAERLRRGSPEAGLAVGVHSQGIVSLDYALSRF